MNTNNKRNEINIVREIFIETLNNQFTSKTGFGAYAHLAPMDVNKLFKVYLKQNKPIESFIKHSVKDHLFKLK